MAAWNSYKHFYHLMWLDDISYELPCLEHDALLIDEASWDIWISFVPDIFSSLASLVEQQVNLH